MHVGKLPLARVKGSLELQLEEPLHSGLCTLSSLTLGGGWQRREGDKFQPSQRGPNETCSISQLPHASPSGTQPGTRAS